MKKSELLGKIHTYLDQDDNDFEVFEDLYACLKDLYEEDLEFLKENIEISRSKIERKIKKEYVREDKDWRLIEDLDNMLYKTHLLLAKDLFEDFLIALEWGRKPSEKFYEPRRSRLKAITDGLQDLADDKLDELFISQPPRTGKLLADDTPILTTKGWKNHGDLVIGDELFTPEGKTTKVIAVHPKHHTTHTITFTDGTSIDCHFRHEWKVYDRNLQRVRLLETQEMIGNEECFSTKYKKGRGHRYRFQLLNKEFLIGEERDLPIDPYTFGAWLGDGSNMKPCITGDKNDTAIIDKIISNGYIKTREYVHKTTNVLTHVFDTKMRTDLQKIGLCHSRKRNEKYIPAEYLIASIGQRLELLAGLLDTDGTLVKKEHRYKFTTCEESLKNGIISLIATFGWRISVMEYNPKTSSTGIVGKKKYWVISFNPTISIPCVLERKKLNEFSKQRRISIKSIIESEWKRGNCITVEGDGMYLAGKTLKPTHNTTMAMFYMLWLIGRDSEKSNLYCSYSDIITSAFYGGVLEILQDNVTYRYGDIFPEAKLMGTNAKEETLDLNRRKRYHSLTARSLYGTLNGATDCNGLLMADDLIGSIEEALNPDRLVAAWSKVDNNMIPRAKEGAKLLWVGTRWSMYDPTGIRYDLLSNDDKYKSRRFKIINVPALDENDESNFDYEYGVGFSSEYYQQRRSSFERNNDMASWLAQYQGEPIERQGTVFDPSDMRYFNGVLPEEKPDRKFMAIDPAWGGGDYVAAPICYQYGDEIYVVDVVYSNAEKTITQPLLANTIQRYEIEKVQVEANKMTMEFKDGIEDNLKGYKCTMTTKAAPNNKAKEQRIFDKAPDIREHFIFLEDGKRSKEYSLFMQNVYSFKITGRNKHDDAPDSLCMACDIAFYQSLSKPQVFKRFF